MDAQKEILTSRKTFPESEREKKLEETIELLLEEIGEHKDWWPDSLRRAVKKASELIEE